MPFETKVYPSRSLALSPLLWTSVSLLPALPVTSISDLSRVGNSVVELVAVVLGLDILRHWFKRGSWSSWDGLGEKRAIAYKEAVSPGKWPVVYRFF